MKWWALISASLAPVSMIGGWLIAQSRQPESYNWVTQTISALASPGATDRWIMTAGLALVGTCHLVTAAALPQVGAPGRGLLALGGVATVMTAVIAQPAGGHVVAAGIAFIALALWIAFSRVPRLGPRLMAFAIVATLLMWLAFQLRSGSTLGLTERMVAGAESLWPLAVAVLLAVRQRREQPRER